jgi:hypothetical protein
MLVASRRRRDLRRRSERREHPDNEGQPDPPPSDPPEGKESTPDFESKGGLPEQDL